MSQVIDRFVKKCPECGAILQKESLHVDHKCECDFVWEGSHNSTPSLVDFSKIEI